MCCRRCYAIAAWRSCSRYGPTSYCATLWMLHRPIIAATGDLSVWSLSNSSRSPW